MTSGETLSELVLGILGEFDERAAALPEPPTIYLVGAASLVLEGITDRATQDVDYICDEAGEALVNIILPEGLHSHWVPSGLVSMPPGWRERSRAAPGFHGRHCQLRVPELADRLVDKLARGSATDWQDIEAILRSPRCPDPVVVREKCACVVAAPPSTVFVARAFRANYERLRELFRSAGLGLAEMEGGQPVEPAARQEIGNGLSGPGSNSGLLD